MASKQLITEDEKIIMMETVPGNSDLSELNDIAISPINTDTFDISPDLNNWTFGTNWSWDSVNKRFQYTP